MRIDKVEKILKSKMVVENKKRAIRVKQGYNPERNQPLNFTEVLGFNWQVRNKIFKGRNGNCTFDPVSMQAHSYKHWRFVDIIKGKVVFNQYRYSHTTSTHQQMVLSVLCSLGIKIDLEVDMYESLTSFTTNALPAMYCKLAGFEVVLNRKGVRAKTKDQYNSLVLEVKSKITSAKRLGAVCSKKCIAEIYAEAKQQELKRLSKLASERVSRACESYASKQLELTGKVIDINQFT